VSEQPKIVIQKMWDVTIVDFQEARLLDSLQIESIGQQLYKLVDEMDRKKIVLDFSKVQFLSSAAVSVLLVLQQKMKKINGQYVICGLKKELMKVFEIMKLTNVLKFAADESEALRVFGYTAAG
jgi:anti-sigma B factor antagonist